MAERNRQSHRPTIMLWRRAALRGWGADMGMRK
jgi:hypothetical protein